jgi:hypothetical protein
MYIPYPRPKSVVRDSHKRRAGPQLLKGPSTFYNLSQRLPLLIIHLLPSFNTYRQGWMEPPCGLDYSPIIIWSLGIRPASNYPALNLPSTNFLAGPQLTLNFLTGPQLVEAARNFSGPFNKEKSPRNLVTPLKGNLLKMPRKI